MGQFDALDQVAGALGIGGHPNSYFQADRLQVAQWIFIVSAVLWVLVAIWTFVVTPSWVRVPADAYGTRQGNGARGPGASLS